MSRKFVAAILVTFISQPSFAQRIKLEQPGLKPYKCDRPIDIARLARLDAEKIPPAVRPFIRYVWVSDGDAKSYGVHSFAINLAVTRTPNLVRPVKIAGHKLVRWDARLWGNSRRSDGKGLDVDVAEILSIYENLEEDPYFHTVVEVVAEDGKTSKEFEFASHLANTEDFAVLSKLLQTNSPIVRHDYFLVRALSTTDIGFGKPLYYDFAQIGTSEDQNDFAVFLANMGIDINKVEKENISDFVNLFKSGVTDNFRQFVISQSPNFRPSKTSAAVTYTKDPSVDQVGIGNDPFRNPRDFKFSAIEAIGFKLNGMPTYGLFAANGKRQDAAPANVVTDFLTPSGPAQLHGAISCLRCHGTQDGWLSPDQNLADTLKGPLDFFDDLSQQGNQLENVLEFASKFGNDIERPLQRNRDDFNTLTLWVTEGMGVKATTQHLSNTWKYYVHDDVSPIVAVNELSCDADTDEAALLHLNQLIGKIPPADKRGISPEDIVIAALKDGKRVKRHQYNKVFADLMLRAALNYQPEQKQQGMAP